MKEINVDEIYKYLKKTTLYFKNGYKVVDNDGYTLCKLRGFPACCGAIILHRMDEDMDLKAITDELLKVLEKNIQAGKGASRYFAITSSHAGFTTDWFRSDGRWKETYDFFNSGIEANELTLWVLEPQNQ